MAGSQTTFLLDCWCKRPDSSAILCVTSRADLEPASNRARCSIQIHQFSADRGTTVDAPSVEQAASYYLKIRAYTEAICRAYGIACIFILQPTSLVERHSSKTTEYITQSDLNHFPFDQELYTAGYNHILSGAAGKYVMRLASSEGEENALYRSCTFQQARIPTDRQIHSSSCESEPCPPHAQEDEDCAGYVGKFHGKSGPLNTDLSEALTEARFGQDRFCEIIRCINLIQRCRESDQSF